MSPSAWSFGGARNGSESPARWSPPRSPMSPSASSNALPMFSMNMPQSQPGSDLDPRVFRVSTPELRSPAVSPATDGFGGVSSKSSAFFLGGSGVQPSHFTGLTPFSSNPSLPSVGADTTSWQP